MPLDDAGRSTFNEVNDWAHGTNSTFVEPILRCVQYKEIREGGGTTLEY